MRRLLLTVSLVLGSSPAIASGEAAEALVRAFGIPTYTASRKDQDVYELLEGYVVRTRYCYEYVYFEDVVVKDDKIIFIESDAVCDVAGIYRA